jgi:Ankyrin repeats (many copies)
MDPFKLEAKPTPIQFRSRKRTNLTVGVLITMVVSLCAVHEAHRAEMNQHYLNCINRGWFEGALHDIKNGAQPNIQTNDYGIRNAILAHWARLTKHGYTPNTKRYTTPTLCMVLDPDGGDSLTAREKLAGLVISSDADVNQTDPFGTPPLKLAVLCGAHRTVSRLLAAGANPDVEDVYYETPLICAIRRNDQTSVEILLAHGASVNLKTINGKSAFDYARKLDNRITVELLRRYDRLERSGRSASKPTTNTTHRSHVIPSAEQLNGTDLPLPE